MATVDWHPFIVYLKRSALGKSFDASAVDTASKGELLNLLKELPGMGLHIVPRPGSMRSCATAV